MTQQVGQYHNGRRAEAQTVLSEWKAVLVNAKQLQSGSDGIQLTPVALLPEAGL
jgi:hypothetical protein